jgi:pimeloyl-ACP methyl ester carboxylesterase
MRALCTLWLACFALLPPPAVADDPGPLARIAAAARASLTEAGLERVEVVAAGRRLVTWRGGSGPHLVLLHGSGQQAGSWAAVAPGLLDSYTVHALDLPGHGDSEPAEGPLPMADVVAGVEAYLLSLDGPAVLVGSSLGAWLATLQAHRHPERVARAVLVNGGALLNVPVAGLTLTPADREEARRVMAAIRDPASPPLPDEVLDDIVARSRSGPTGRMMQDLAGLMSHLLDGRLGEVEVPVDAIWGASDGLMPLDYARRMVDQLPRARLTVLEKCGHIPPSECPERFLAVLREVLARPPVPPPEAPPREDLPEDGR